LHGDGKLRTALNGVAALAEIQAEPVDVLITDVRMPLMDGVTLVRRLAEAGLRIPTIIFVSGFSDVNEREMYSLGVEAFLPKPVRREELILVLEKALADQTSLWRIPLSGTPRQSLNLEIENPEESGFRLGRGGFCVRCPTPLSLGKIAFHCTFSAAQREMNGQGYVRWYSQSDRSVGIELAFLDSSCHSWISEAIAATRTQSFIPV
jgi:CheY-like chemotaxis protein